MLLESVYSRSFCWNRASYLEGEQDVTEPGGDSRAYRGISAAPNRPALRWTSHAVPASVHLSPASGPLERVRSLTGVLHFSLQVDSLFFQNHREHQWHPGLRSTSSWAGASHSQLYLLQPPQPGQGSWQHLPLQALAHVPFITWKLSLLIFTNLVPSQFSGLTLTALSSETPSLAPPFPQWPPPGFSLPPVATPWLLLPPSLSGHLLQT